MQVFLKLYRIQSLIASSLIAPPGLLFKFDHSTDRGGIGAFALQDIKAGTEILAEEAILKGTNEHICKEALFKVLSDDKKKRVMFLYHHCSAKYCSAPKHAWHKSMKSTPMELPQVQHCTK